MKSPGFDGIEIRSRDILDLRAADLGMDSAYLAANGSSILKFLDRYNSHILLAHMVPAICDPGAKEAVCEKYAR